MKRFPWGLGRIDREVLMTREALDAQRRGHAVRILLAEPSLETLQLPFIRLGRNQIGDGIMENLETTAYPLQLPQDR